MKYTERDKSYFTAIGRFVHHFSTVEASLKSGIERALDLSNGDAVRVLVHDFAMTCSITQSVMSSRSEDKAIEKQLQKLIGRARHLNDHRVRIVHGFWATGTDPNGVALYHISRNKLEFEEFYSTSEEIERLADEAVAVFLELEVLFDKVVPRPDA